MFALHTSTSPAPITFDAGSAFVTGAEVLGRVVVVRIIFDSMTSARAQAAALRCGAHDSELAWLHTSTGGGSLDQVGQFEFSLGELETVDEITVGFDAHPRVTLRLQTVFLDQH